MRRLIGNSISVLFSILKFSLMKLIYGKRFEFTGIQRFSPNTEVVLSGQGSLCLGDRVRVHRRSKLSVSGQGKLSIGKNTAIGRDSGIYCMESIRIGKDCQIAEGTKIYDHDHDFRASGGLRAGKFKTAPVIIGDNVWIGCNTIILRGTTIGDNCVVGAGSVLKGNYPADSIIIQKRATEIISCLPDEP